MLFLKKIYEYAIWMLNLDDAMVHCTALIHISPFILILPNHFFSLTHLATTLVVFATFAHYACKYYQMRTPKHTTNKLWI